MLIMYLKLLQVFKLSKINAKTSTSTFFFSVLTFLSCDNEHKTSDQHKEEEGKGKISREKYILFPQKNTETKIRILRILLNM